MKTKGRQILTYCSQEYSPFEECEDWHNRLDEFQGKHNGDREYTDKDRDDVKVTENKQKIQFASQRTRRVLPS